MSQSRLDCDAREVNLFVPARDGASVRLERARDPPAGSCVWGIMPGSTGAQNTPTNTYIQRENKHAKHTTLDCVYAFIRGNGESSSIHYRNAP